MQAGDHNLRLPCIHDDIALRNEDAVEIYLQRVFVVAGQTGCGGCAHCYAVVSGNGIGVAFFDADVAPLYGGAKGGCLAIIDGLFLYGNRAVFVIIQDHRLPFSDGHGFFDHRFKAIDASCVNRAENIVVQFQRIIPGDHRVSQEPEPHGESLMANRIDKLSAVGHVNGAHSVSRIVRDLTVGDYDGSIGTKRNIGIVISGSYSDGFVSIDDATCQIQCAAALIEDNLASLAVEDFYVLQEGVVKFRILLQMGIGGKIPRIEDIFVGYHVLDGDPLQRIGFGSRNVNPGILCIVIVPGVNTAGATSALQRHLPAKIQRQVFGCDLNVVVATLQGDDLFSLHIVCGDAFRDMDGLSAPVSGMRSR